MAVLSAGRDGCLVLIEDGRKLRRWQLGDSVAHWAGHLEGSIYLVASDIWLGALEAHGIRIERRLAHWRAEQDYNREYLETKRLRQGHLA